MITVQFSGEIVSETFDADGFYFLEPSFVILTKGGKEVAAIRADRVQYIRKSDAA